MELPQLSAERLAPYDLPPPPEPTARRVYLLALLLASVLAAAWWWRDRLLATPTVPAPASASSPAPREPNLPALDSGAARVAGDAERHPLAVGDGPQLSDAGILAGLQALLGRAEVGRFVLTDGFARRIVATVDGLGRDHVPAPVWPVPPTAGRFTVTAANGRTSASADNAARYADLVALVAAVDPKAAAAFYLRLYPQLQQAWRELGMGRQSFNDRLIEVIDLLLATPEPAQAPSLHLTQVKGPIPSVRPWVRYEFEDPRLQRLSSGQRILLRVGPAHQARLKRKLRELRAAILHLS